MFNIQYRFWKGKQQTGRNRYAGGGETPEDLIFTFLYLNFYTRMQIFLKKKENNYFLNQQKLCFYFN